MQSDKTNQFPEFADYPARNWLLFGMFLSYVFYHYLQVGYRVPILGQIRAQFILGAVLSFFAVLSLLQRKEEHREPPVRWALWLIFLFAIMVVFSADPGTSWQIFVDRVLKFGMLAIFIIAFVRSPGDLKWFLAVYLLAFLKMGQEGVVGVLGGGLYWENQGILRLHGSTPVYHHPNSFSGTQIGTLPFLIFLLPLLPRFLKGVAVLQIGLALWVAVFTGSRTGYLGLVAVIGSAIALARSRLKMIGVVIVGLAALSPLVPDQYWGRAATIIEFEESQSFGSITARREILRQAWAIFTDNPLGVGVGAFPVVRAARYGEYQDTHNLYLEVATNIGIQGLVVFGLFLIAIYGALFALRNDLESQEQALDGIESLDDRQTGLIDSHRRDLHWLKMTTLALIAFLNIRLILGLFGHDLYEVYWWFALGLTVALGRINRIATARTAALAEGNVPGVSVTGDLPANPAFGRADP